MRLRYLKLMYLLLSFTAFSQGAYIGIGKNFTTYNFKDLQGEATTAALTGNGNSYEIGYTFYVDYDFTLDLGVALNAYNAVGGDGLHRYSWDTNYLGVQSTVGYEVLGDYRSYFNVVVQAGLNLNHIISGTQQIDGQTFDLTEEPEFTGLFVQPLAGAEVNYKFTRTLAVGVVYRYGINFGVTNTTDQKLHFNNHQLVFHLRKIIY